MAVDWRLGLVDSGRNAMDIMTAFDTGRKAAIEQNAIRAREVGRHRASQQLAGGNAAQAQQTAMASGDFDYAKAIGSYSEDQRKQFAAESEAMGSAAFSIKSLPVEQRRQAFGQVAQRLGGMFSREELAQAYQTLEANGWSDQALDGYVNQALSAKDALAAYTKQNEQYTLAPGSARYDARGNLVVQQPFAPQYKSVSPGETLIEVQPEGGGPASTGDGSRGERNGNPGNIKDGPWARSQPGYIGSDGTFAQFEPGAGAAAQEKLLAANYIGKGFDTPAEIVNRYAPPGENGADSIRNYTSYVAQRLGIGVNDPVPANRVGELAQAMREFETGNTVGRGRSGGGSRVVATGAPKAGWQTLSSGEAASMGLPAGPVYQRGPDGEVKAVTGTASASDTSQLTKTQAGVIRTKLQSINAIESQLGRVEAAMRDLDKKGWTGTLGGLVPGSWDAESDRFDKSVAALAPLVRQLTRVPGEGAMSDYESRLADMALPNRRSTPEGRKEIIASMKELLRNTRSGYRELLGQGAAATRAAPSGRKPSVSNW